MLQGQNLQGRSFHASFSKDGQKHNPGAESSHEDVPDNPLQTHSSIPDRHFIVLRLWDFDWLGGCAGPK